ncbi:hypothetical protein RQP46_000832 [Phenoliferia psychrophenolica]
MTESLPLTPRTSSDSGRDSPSPARPSHTLSPLHSRPSSPDRAPDAFNGRSTGPDDFDDDDDDEDDDEGRASEDADASVGEGSPMLHKFTSSRNSKPPKQKGAAQAALSPTEDDREELLRLDSDDSDDALGSGTPSGVLSGQWESTATDSPNLWSESRLTRGQKRRVYGGGRHGDAMEGGGMSAGEVAGLVLAGTLGPTPLLLPHAAALLGLPLFLPLLFLTAALSWFSYLVLGVESRYVGARSWPSLASAVFPHRFKTHRFGEFLASFLVWIASVARGIVGVVAASEVVVDLLLPAGGARLWERVLAIGVITLSWVLVPLFILPFIRSPHLRHRPTSPNTASALSRVPAYIAFLLWPIALLILGVRLKKLNELAPSPAPPPPLDVPAKVEIMGLSIWGGISILVFALSAHQDTFRFITSLARPPSTATRATRSPSIGARTSGSDSSGGPEGRRNQWPIASAIGVGGAVLIQMGWGLVGYLGIEGGGREGNLFASTRLPRADPWLVLVRVLVLIAILVALENSLDAAYARTRKAAVLVFGKGATSGRSASKAVYSRIGNEDERRIWDWRTAFSRIAVWAVVAIVGVVTAAAGEQGEGIVSVAELGGCIASSMLGFLGPSIFFIALFHLRQPRSIFISDPSAPMFATDTLLMRKEREVQRRLSGRRIWMDVLVFGGLLPFGTVVVLRGAIALATKED